MIFCYDDAMDGHHHISPPTGEADTEGAYRVFDEFLLLYQPAMLRAEYYLAQVIEQVEPAFAEAYRPWHQALHSLFRGVYLTTKHIEVPDVENFVEALKLFSFESAIQFLRDICISCRIPLTNDWAERFREHINLLLFSASILNRTKQPAIVL